MRKAPHCFTGTDLWRGRASEPSDWICSCWSLHHLADLAKGNYVCESAEAQDVEECVGALQRSASRTDEDVAPFLPSQKRAYVFGGMAAAAARFVMWLLPELKVSIVFVTCTS